MPLAIGKPSAIKNMSLECKALKNVRIAMAAGLLIPSVMTMPCLMNARGAVAVDLLWTGKTSKFNIIQSTSGNVNDSPG
jgi:hypothetical protein